MDLGDRMKMYEQLALSRAMPGLPLAVRLDGKRFSKWTRGLERPYDARLSAVMVETTKALVKETGAVIGYTQSDEITLVFYEENYNSQMWLGGRYQKMASITASIATAYFGVAATRLIPEKVGRLAFFDSRAFALPSKEEAANAVLWREIDATKNSISMACRNFYSHKEMHKKSAPQMQEMIFQKGVNWNDYPAFFKRGTFVRRVVASRLLTEQEMSRGPQEQKMVMRSSIEEIEMPPFRTVANRVAVIFEGDTPVCLEV